MLKLINIAEGTVCLYKQLDNPLPAGKYYQYLGRPNDLQKKSFALKACQFVRGNGFLWVAPAEAWVKRVCEGMIIQEPRMTEEPDWNLIGFNPGLLRSWQAECVKEVWNYLRQGLKYGRGWIAKMGAGKTLAGLVVGQMFEPGEFAVLVDRYLFETWESQAAEWGLNKPLLSTYESAHKLPPTVKYLAIDEILRLKNSSAQRSVKAARIAAACEVVIGFTGIATAGGGPLDFRWLRVISEGCVPAEDNAWKFAFGLDTQLKDVGANKAYVTTEWDDDRIAAFVAPFIHTVDSASIDAELPELTFTYITCPQPSMYKQIAMGAGTTKGVHKKLAQALQCTDGFIYNDDEKPVRIPAPKLDILKAWVDDLGEPVILVSAWTEGVAQLAEIFAGYLPSVVQGGTTDAGAQIDRFKSGQTRMMILNAGFSKGMNLQKVCRTICFLSPSTKPDDYAQMIARVHRPGQKDAVQIVHFCCEDSLDRRRIELVQSHKEMNEEFVEKLLLEELNK